MAGFYPFLPQMRDLELRLDECVGPDFELPPAKRRRLLERGAGVPIAAPLMAHSSIQVCAHNTNARRRHPDAHKSSPVMSPPALGAGPGV